MSKDQDQIIKNILERLEKLESEIFSLPDKDSKPRNTKQKTMTEMVKGKNLNGQQKVMFIVGYFEKILNKKEITITDIKLGWKDAKFNGSYASMILARTLKDGFINDYDKKGEYLMTQSGETLFESLFN